MATVQYDINKLKQLGVIDARNTMSNFKSNEDYFAQLSLFAEKSKYYLRQYSPETIVSRESERTVFLADVRRIKENLFALGIMKPVSTLSELDYAGRQGDAKAISDWLDRFYDEIEQAARAIMESEEKSQAQPVPAAAPETRKPVILAVDDKPELLAAVVNMLEGPFKVMAVTNGKSVLRLIEKHTPELFLLDIEMPEMNGFELADQIRKNIFFEKTPIIFLTSKNSRDHVLGAIKNGGSDYILKPVNKEVLVSKIKQHLNML